jgi:hypothetical protein
MNTFQELTAVLGRDAALRLISKFGNQTIYLTKMSGWHGSFQELSALLTLYRQKLSVSEMSLQTGLQRNTVIDVLEEALTHG